MVRKIFEAIGSYFLFLKMVFRRPEKWRIFWRQFVNEADKLIISSILLVGVISLFIGGVLVIQTASNLENVAKPDLPPQSIHRLEQTHAGLVEKSQLL